MLWPDPARPAPADARTHYDSCASCRHFFQSQAALGVRLKGLKRPPAPAALRRSIERLLTAERLPTRWSVRRVAWLAAGLAAAALAIAIGLNSSGPDLARPFAMQAVRPAAPGASISSTSFQEVEGWLRLRTGMAVRLPEIPEADLEGGRVVEVEGVTTGAAVYDVGGISLIYFAVPALEISGTALDVAAGIVLGSAEGVEVAVWSEPGGIRAVAASMSRADLRAVAADCRNKAFRSAL
jgi:hypothetical protein